MNKNRQVEPENEKIIMNDIISDMMESSYEINQCDNEGFTDLMCACYLGYPDIVEKLLGRGAVLTHTTKFHEDCLILTSYCSNTKIKESLEILDLLITNKTNLNNKDENGDTALILACCNVEAFEFVQRLIISGANFSLTNNSNQTALFLACCNENINAIHHLCSTASSLDHIQKFKIEIENAEDNTATKYAKKMLETVELHISLEKQLALKNKPFTLKI